MLQIPVYLVTSYIVRQLLGSGYRLLIEAGAVLPPNLLLQHFLVVSLFDGFLAGQFGLLVLRATFLLPFRISRGDAPPWKNQQMWTWTIFTCWFILGILGWIAKTTHQSVLRVSSPITFSDLVEAFFGSGCQLTGADIHQMVFGECMNQLSFTHPWLGTIGFSAAALVPYGWLRIVKDQQASHEELPLVVEGQKPEDQNNQQGLAL